jgi:hypothetical protein
MNDENFVCRWKQWVREGKDEIVKRDKKIFIQLVFVSWEAKQIETLAHTWENEAN